MRTKRVKKRESEHAFLSIRVDSYDVRIGASINHCVEQPRYAFRELGDDEPVYEYVTHLTILGTAKQPDERAGERFELVIYGNDAPSRKINATLRDVQARNEYNSPQYREYRGRHIPVVTPIPALAYVDKNRARGSRTAWVNVAPRMVSDMLILLAANRTTYIAIHEVKENRRRWIRRLELQTTDPAEE